MSSLSIYVASIVRGGGGGGSTFVPCFVMQYFVSFLVFQSYDGEQRAGCLTSIFFLISCDCNRPVALS